MYTLIHAVAGYLFLTLMIRVLARRPGAQLTPFEFVLVFLIGGVIILATIGDDHSITNCYGGVIAICLMHRLVGALKRRSPRWANIIDGTPIVLLQNDEWQESSMKHSNMDAMDVMAAAREKNVRTLDQIKYAVLERNGSISVIKKKS
jgi:uncharacterized membrane protein YcaP (DUF421 family)